MKTQCDIDIDFANREDILSKIPHVVAGRIDRGEYKRHNTGVYLQNMPVNPLTGLATIDYETAEQRGYFKIDFLNVNAYQGVKNEEHIKQLLSVEPLWDLMYEKEVCDQLFHINGYHNLLAQLKPTSILELATVLALIRPGKKHLVPICVEKGFQAIQDEVWIKTEEGYSFKKSHAIGYAHVIVMQLNLICERVSYGFS
jgi:DNA polymerase III alpha subunit